MIKSEEGQQKHILEPNETRDSWVCLRCGREFSGDEVYSDNLEVERPCV